MRGTSKWNQSYNWTRFINPLLSWAIFSFGRHLLSVNITELQRKHTMLSECYALCILFWEIIPMTPYFFVSEEIKCSSWSDLLKQKFEFKIWKIPWFEKFLDTHFNISCIWYLFNSFSHPPKETIYNSVTHSVLGILKTENFEVF